MCSEAASESRPAVELKKHWFNILLALADGARHGYAIRARVEEQTRGMSRLYPATLYGAVRAMSDCGLIEEVDGDDASDDDRRRRYYGLTALGRRVLRYEVDRLQGLVDAARATRALGEA